jgi:hypothetical protein
MKNDVLNETVLAEVCARGAADGLPCAEAFGLAEELEVRPLVVGRAADATDVRLVRCQLGLFGYGARKTIVAPADDVSPELEQAIREGLILGRLPCAVAWALAARFGWPKLQIANAAEGLGIRISECQLGGF